MIRTRRPLFSIVVAALPVLAGAAVFINCSRPPTEEQRAEAAAKAVHRQNLFDELRPVKLSNCTFARFGEKNDGGYVLCTNLLDEARAAYSYGIGGHDGWGCDMSSELKVSVHQYDCFDLTQPVCPAGGTVFHPECVAGQPGTIDGRPFDTVTNQLARNGDGDKHIVMKMDVEGAEWDTLLKTPGDVLERIDQLAIELHGNDDPKFLAVVRHLKQFFHVVHVHPNNWSCTDNMKPFPSWAYQVLLVNKRLGVVDPAGVWPGRLPVDAPDNPKTPDCELRFK